MLTFDLYWSFRSPYSYLATPRLRELCQDYKVMCNVRPVYPIMVRVPDFLHRKEPTFGPYLMMDCHRVGDQLGLPFAWPKPDPVVVDPKTQQRSDDQPYIRRLTQLGCAAAETANGLDFLYEVSREIWGGVPDWHEGDRLADATARAGLDLKVLDARIAAAPQKYDDIIANNEAAQEQAGHWGVPLMVFDGEPFFGQDRVEMMIWRMEQKGLEAREKRKNG